MGIDIKIYTEAKAWNEFLIRPTTKAKVKEKVRGHLYSQDLHTKCILLAQDHNTGEAESFQIIGEKEHAYVTILDPSKEVKESVRKKLMREAIKWLRENTRAISVTAILQEDYFYMPKDTPETFRKIVEIYEQMDVPVQQYVLQKKINAVSRGARDYSVTKSIIEEEIYGFQTIGKSNGFGYNSNLCILCNNEKQQVIGYANLWKSKTSEYFYLQKLAIHEEYASSEKIQEFLQKGLTLSTSNVVAAVAADHSEELQQFLDAGFKHLSIELEIKHCYLKNRYKKCKK